MTMPDRMSRDGAGKAGSDRIHEEAERIAVPAFDWIGQPIAALVDAVSALVPHHHSHPPTDGEDVAE